MRGRLWKASELRYLRRVVDRCPFPAIAKHLHRSESACRQAALKDGLYVIGPRDKKRGAEIDRILREMNARGWSDAEIGRLCGISRKAVWGRRRRIGLPSNANNSRHRAKCQPTQFKKGCLRGNAARRLRGVGTITVRKRRRKRVALGGKPRKGGRERWIKVSDKGPPQHRYIPYARWIWEANHGPVPKGKFVVHADGNRLNDALSNLKLVGRREHLALQMARDPGMKMRCRAASSKATRQRHAMARSVRARKAEVLRQRKTA